MLVDHTGEQYQNQKEFWKKVLTTKSIIAHNLFPKFISAMIKYGPHPEISEEKKAKRHFKPFLEQSQQIYSRTTIPTYTSFTTITSSFVLFLEIYPFYLQDILTREIHDTNPQIKSNPIELPDDLFPKITIGQFKNCKFDSLPIIQDNEKKNIIVEPETICDILFGYNDVPDDFIFEHKINELSPKNIKMTNIPNKTKINTNNDDTKKKDTTNNEKNDTNMEDNPIINLPEEDDSKTPTSKKRKLNLPLSNTDNYVTQKLTKRYLEKYSQDFCNQQNEKMTLMNAKPYVIALSVSTKHMIHNHLYEKNSYQHL